MENIKKLIILILWSPGFVIAFPLRFLYQGIIIGIKAADDVVEKTD